MYVNKILLTNNRVLLFMAYRCTFIVFLQNIRSDYGKEVTFENKYKYFTLKF